MSREEKVERFFKRLKVFNVILVLLCLMNIIILVGRNSSYALFRRTVSSKRVIEIHTAKEFPSKLGVEVLKKKLGDDGLVGIPNNCSEESCDPITDKNADKSTIREYRYSGLGVNNYVTFNNETWRIIGIFKDEKGQEHVKIVRNEVLKRDVFPLTYTANETTYKIQYTGSGDYAYWNYHSDNTYNNNWGDSGLMNWLNSTGTENGYLKTLTSTAQNMIEKTKYYLGTLTYDDTNYMKDTVAEAYNNERAVTGCTENKGPSANSSKEAVEGNSTCRVWANNAATWNGKIGLMYTSDYGYTVDSQYWTNTMISYKGFTSTIVDTSWLQKEANHLSHEWFLSPSSANYDHIVHWYSAGRVNNNHAYDYIGVRPALYIQSQVAITGGTGKSDNPYQLFCSSCTASLN